MNTEPTSTYHQLLYALVIDMVASLASNLIQSLALQVGQAAGWC